MHLWTLKRWILSVLPLAVKTQPLLGSRKIAYYFLLFGYAAVISGNVHMVLRKVELFLGGFFGGIEWVLGVAFHGE